MIFQIYSHAKGKKSRKKIDRKNEVFLKDNVETKQLFNQILNTSIIAQETLFINETQSTNDDVWKYYNKYKSIVIVADKQTKGRGRLGNRWYSNPNQSLTFSFNINTNIQPNILALITGISVNYTFCLEYFVY